MNRPLLLGVILIDLAAILVLAAVRPDLMLAPGDLIPGHETLARNCLACHAPGAGPVPARCVECHEVDRIGLQTTRGVTITRPDVRGSFHQHLTEPACTTCHSDHRGVASFRERVRFSHDLIEASFRERCATCHQPPGDRLHRGVGEACARCHSVAGWKPADFDHDESFRLDRDHDADCVTCHVKSDFSRYTCYGCHEHRPDRIRNKHIEEGIPNFQDCVRCHRSADEGEARGGREGGERRREGRREGHDD